MTDVPINKTMRTIVVTGKVLIILEINECLNIIFIVCITLTI